MHCSGRTNSKLNMLLIGPEARLHLMSKRWMSSASTSVFCLLPHAQICTSVDVDLAIKSINSLSAKHFLLF